jgi:hypothetical protein
LVPPRGDVWQDFVAVFGKHAGELGAPTQERERILPLFPAAIDCGAFDYGGGR